jgi:hypothetical protein
MAIVRPTKIMSDVDLSKSDRGISGTSDREGLYQEYRTHQRKTLFFAAEAGIKLLKGSISHRRFPLMMLSVFGLEKSKHRLPNWVNIESFSVDICWSYVVLRL